MRDALRIPSTKQQQHQQKTPEPPGKGEVLTREGKPKAREEMSLGSDHNHDESFRQSWWCVPVMHSGGGSRRLQAQGKPDSHCDTLSQKAKI